MPFNIVDIKVKSIILYIYLQRTKINKLNKTYTYMHFKIVEVSICPLMKEQAVIVDHI